MQTNSITAAQQHQDDHQYFLVSLKTACKLLDCSSSLVSKLVKDGKLPQPIYLSDKSPRWKREDVLALASTLTETE